MSFSAIILAGQRPGGDPLSGAEGKPHKALIEVEGRSLLERVAMALKGAGAEHIGVACDQSHVIALAGSLGLEVVPTGRSPSESAAIALERYGAPLLLTTADHALLESGWVTGLIEGTGSDADIGIMMARRCDVEEVLPASQRTYMRLSDGAWSGCNLFLFRSENASRAIKVWRSVEADRKRPWRIARKLGVRTLVSYAMGNLSFQQGIDKLGARIGATGKLVPAPSGLAAIDVDKLQDLKDVRRILAERRQ